MAYTAHFLTVNGVPLQAHEAGQRRSDTDRWGRGSGTELTGTTFSRKRDVAFNTTPMPAIDALALSGWIRGVGHHFTYNWFDAQTATAQFTLYSSEGGAKMSGGTAATVAKWGQYSLDVASGTTSTVTAKFGLEGTYSFSVWRYQVSAGTWEMCSAAYDGATTRFFVDTATTTAFAWASLTATVGYFRLGLQGKDPDNAATECLYDGLMVLPYTASSAILSARVGRTTGEPRFPLVAVGGHSIRPVSELVCMGRVEAHPFYRVAMNSRWHDNARCLEGSFAESTESIGAGAAERAAGYVPPPDFWLGAEVYTEGFEDTEGW